MLTAGHAAPAITPRDLSFDVDASKIEDWADGDYIATTFFNALSLLFPEGEKFFIASVAALRDQVTDPALQADVKAFVQQEAMHTREHIAYNRALAKIIDVEAVDEKVRGRIAFIRKMTPPVVHLAITAALEHFTAIMAHELLSRDEYLEGADPTYARMWTWHAIEECEHKSVAFDVLAAATKGKNVWLRRRIMVSSTINFSLDIASNCYRLFAARGLHRSPATWAKLAWYLLARPGFARRIVPAYFKYYKADFHPSQIDDDRERERGLAQIAFSPAH